MTKSTSPRRSGASALRSDAGIADGWATNAFKLGAKRLSSAAQLAKSEAGATSRLGNLPVSDVVVPSFRAVPAIVAPSFRAAQSAGNASEGAGLKPGATSVVGLLRTSRSASTWIV